MRYLILALSISLFSLSACAHKKAPPPREPQYFEHVIKYEGETLGLISSWYTGAASNWQEIADHNPGLRVNRLRIGNVILIPEDLISRHEPLPRKAVTSYAKKVVADPRSPETAPAKEASPSEKQAEASPTPEQTQPEAAPSSDQPAPPAVTPQEQEKQKTRDDLIDEILKN